MMQICILKPIVDDGGHGQGCRELGGNNSGHRHHGGGCRGGRWAVRMEIVQLYRPVLCNCRGPICFYTRP